MLVDPLQMIRTFWPGITLYREQKEILYSVEENPETVVPAANQLGKDFIAGLIVLIFFLRRKSARVVTTSVDFPQLEKVLWGEMKQFISSAEYLGKRVKLPLKVNHMEIKRINGGVVDPKGYIIGRTAADQAGLQGHHLARGENGEPTTLAVYDEASGISPPMFQATAAWRHSCLIIGNCFPCRNYFYQSSKEGDLFGDDGRLIRRVIRVKAEESPNVRYALAEKEAGLEISYKELIPGVVGYRDYLIRRKTWDPISQKIGLDAEFYEDESVRLYPVNFIDLSCSRAEKSTDNVAVSLGIDPASGGDSTSFATCSETKLLDIHSLKTPDTSRIVDHTIELINHNNLQDNMVGIDSGGGGLQIAHFLRRKGYKVRTVNFGSAFKPQKRAGTPPIRVREESEEKQKAYKNKRAFLFHLLRLRLDPNSGWELFDIPIKCLRYQFDENHRSLREQMEPIPLLYDEKGVIYMVPKTRKTKIEGGTEDRQITLHQLIGHSPDELEALLVSLFVQYDKPVFLGGSL